MRQLNSNRMGLVLFGVAAVMVLSCGSAKADFIVGEPTNMGPAINSPGEEFGPSISNDALEFYFESDRPGRLGSFDIWVATRQTTDNEWGRAVNFGPVVNSVSDDMSPCISADGLVLYFCSDRPGGSGALDLWVTTRDTLQGDWGTPVNLGPTINGPYDEVKPSISSDGLSLFFSDGDWPSATIRPGGQGQSDIWVSTRLSEEAPWGAPVNLGPPVNSDQHDTTPSISDDGLTLVFGRGSFDSADIWLTTRKTLDAPWEAPIRLGLESGSGAWGGAPDISGDGSTVHWVSYKAGGMGNADIWQLSITPLVDFNGDGRVDGFEFTKVVDNWSRNDPSCDVGPLPMGNGVVDVQDLIVLSKYIGQDLDDPTLIAHWALDEKEGTTATDSVGENHANVTGDPTWLPNDGIVGGALLLDGDNDYLVTGAVRDPSEGPLSVFAWVQGGAPGQVIASQIAGVSWLMAEETGGVLTTVLKQPGRNGKTLVSEVLITDGHWHRVGLVWDGTNRSLYVDDVLVATDTQTELSGSLGGLNIGCDKNATSGSFWSGLIDDVRIYNRAVKP